LNNNAHDAIACPSCRAAMQRLHLDGKMHDAVAIDLCFGCQGIWFDSYESVRIAPGGIIELFRLIHEHRDDPRLPIPGRLNCPRCDETLLHSMDVGKSGRFNYYRCLQNHGRFTPFAQLMIEKGFVRQLSAVEIQTIAARISTITCSGCGAPFDIRTDPACPHCRAPITILDPDAVEQALANYQTAAVRQTQGDPLALADALLASERSRQLKQSQRQDDLGALIGVGLDAVWTLIKH
jgi:hypothetical protein